MIARCWCVFVNDVYVRYAFQFYLTRVKLRFYWRLNPPSRWGMRWLQVSRVDPSGKSRQQERCNMRGTCYAESFEASRARSLDFRRLGLKSPGKMDWSAKICQDIAVDGWSISSSGHPTFLSFLWVSFSFEKWLHLASIHSIILYSCQPVRSYDRAWASRRCPRPGSRSRFHGDERIFVPVEVTCSKTQWCRPRFCGGVFLVLQSDFCDFCGPLHLLLGGFWCFFWLCLLVSWLFVVFSSFWLLWFPGSMPQLYSADSE